MMKYISKIPIIVILLAISCMNISWSQNGPGGVSDANLLMWLKANVGTAGGTSISSWTSQGPSPFNVTSSGGLMPTLIQNEMNFNPALDFTNDRLDLPAFAAGNNFDFIVVMKPDVNAPIGLFDSAPNVQDVFRNYGNGAMELWPN